MKYIVIAILQCVGLLMCVLNWSKQNIANVSVSSCHICVVAS